MTYVEAEFLSWSSVSCQVARCIVLLENKACWETVFHFRAFQVGNGSSRPPFLPYLLHFELWGVSQGSSILFWKAWHTLLQSSEQESSITRRQCRHRLLRSALRSTSLHAVPLCSTLPHNTSEYFRILQNTSDHHRTTSFPSPHNLSHHNSAPCRHCWKAKHSISR